MLRYRVCCFITIILLWLVGRHEILTRITILNGAVLIKSMKADERKDALIDRGSLFKDQRYGVINFIEGIPEWGFQSV